MIWNCRRCDKEIDDKECKHEAKSNYIPEKGFIRIIIYRWCPHCEASGPVSVYKHTIKEKQK